MFNKTAAALLSWMLLSPVSLITSTALTQQRATSNDAIGLRDEVQIVGDGFGVPHIVAKNEEDAYFAMGYVHARDRFIQMDYARRLASGTLAELLGPGERDRILGGDIQARRLGFRRWAESSRSLYDAQTISILQAYTDGVNAWINNNSLPPEYAKFEVTKSGVPKWDLLDSLAIVKLTAYQLSYDPSDLNVTRWFSVYQKAAPQHGWNAEKLFFRDVFRAAPFDSTITVNRRQNDGPRTGSPGSRPASTKAAIPMINSPTLQAVDASISSTADLAFVTKAETGAGSNWWVVGGSKTVTGLPMIANDPHLGLNLPNTFYQVHLFVRRAPNQPPMNVYGLSLPGVPAVVLGFNDRIAWGATSSHLDVTDFYQEQVVVDPKTRSPMATRYKGKEEPLNIIPEKFRLNDPGDKKTDGLTEVPVGNRASGISVPAEIALVPRRNNGPLLSVMPALGPFLTGISVQFTGFGPTRELEAFLIWARARNVTDFKQGVQRLDSLTQNWSYADVDGNIAYFASGKIPLREDLEAGAVDGAPPFIIRDGTGEHRNEWISKKNSSGDQTTKYEVLPFDEMPQVVNPPEGYIVNANNDPLGLSLDNDPFNARRKNGKAIYYIKRWFDPGLRAGRINRYLANKFEKRSGALGKISLKDMMELQGDTYLADFEVLLPHLFRAFDAARSAGAAPELAAFAKDNRIVEAMERLRKWDLTTPTGIPEGYDASDENGKRLPPTEQEVKNSIAATIAVCWRGRLVMDTIDAALKRFGLASALPLDTAPMRPLGHFLESFPANKGRGESGVSFFDIPELNLPPEVERDILLLKSMKNGLDFLAGEDAEPVFKRSANQDDYRWGKLHRIVFNHMLGPVMRDSAIPPAGGFIDSFPPHRGISCDGGFGAVDAADHRIRVWDTEGFLFGGGPVIRFVAQAQQNGFKSFAVIPGGQSAVPGSEFYANLLPLWLTNDYHETYFTVDEINKAKRSVELLKPRS